MMDKDVGRVPSEPGSRANTEPQSSQRLGPSGFDPSRLDMLAHRHMRVLEKLEPGRRYRFSAISADAREALFLDKLARFVSEDVRRAQFELTPAGIAAKGFVLSCPFCGSHDTRADSEFAGDERVFCGLCGATGPASPDRAHAIYMWNTAPRDSDGSPGRDAQRLDGEAATARAVGIAPKGSPNVC